MCFANFRNNLAACGMNERRSPTDHEQYWLRLVSAMGVLLSRATEIVGLSVPSVFCFETNKNKRTTQATNKQLKTRRTNQQQGSSEEKE